MIIVKGEIRMSEKEQFIQILLEHPELLDVAVEIVTRLLLQSDSQKLACQKGRL